MRKNILVMTMLVFCVGFIFLSSVSAADGNSAIGTVDNVSQEVIPVIDEVNDVNVDDAIPAGDNVVNIENNKLIDDWYQSDDDCTKVTVYTYFDCKYGVENTTVKITPTVRDSVYVNSNIITGGILKVYSDYYKTDLIASIDLDNETSFDYKVPECPGHVYSKSVPIFYTYEKYDPENNILYRDLFYFDFISLNTNNFTISVRDSEGREFENDTIEIDEGEPLFLHIDNLDYKYGATKITIKVDGVDNNRCFVKSINFDYMKHNILFGDATLPVGEYVLSAICEEYAQDDYYHAGAESNKITFKVNPLVMDDMNDTIVMDDVNDTIVMDDVNDTFVMDDMILPKTVPLQPIVPVLDDKNYTEKFVRVSLDCNYGVENSTVKITPTVRDSKYEGANVIAGGILNVYSDYHKTNLIASIDLDNETSFDYKVPECPAHVSSDSVPIFYTYEKYDSENDILYCEKSSFEFHTMNTNNFTISVRDSEGRESQNDTIEIREGEPLFLNIDNLDYKLGSSHIIVKVEGVDNNISSVQQFNFDYMTHKLLFGDATLPVGEYVISAICEETVVNDFYCAGAESNAISVKVVQEADFFDILNGIIDAINNIEVPA